MIVGFGRQGSAGTKREVEAFPHENRRVRGRKARGFQLRGAHLHSWSVQMTRSASLEEVLEAFRASSRIAFLRVADGHEALNTIKEMMSDIGRPRGDLYEVALWEDLVTVQGDEAFYAYAVDNQAIMIPETIDAIRALTGRERSARASIERTNAALGIDAPLIKEPCR